MSGDLDLKPFIWTLNTLGIFSCRYNGAKQPGHFHRTNYHKVRSVVALVMAEITCASLLLYWRLFREEFNIKAYNSTGNIYLNLNFALGCFLIATIYWHFFTCQRFYMGLMESILTYQHDFSLYRCGGWNLRHWYILYVFLVVSNVWNNYKAFEYSELGTGAWACYQVMCDLVFIICGIVIVVYVAMADILSYCLRHVNKEIRKILIVSRGQNKHLLVLMVKRKSLVDLCRQELSERFGLLIILITSFIVFSAPSGPFFFISVTLPQKFESIAAQVMSFAATMYWDVPWLVLFVSVTTCNIEDQANKTAKILAKFSRCNTRIDKMANRTATILAKSTRNNSNVDKIIDKFLLKNLRQKPILTAYGFFSLDKSTLFKLFTTVFTYMVILVQFKEMESSTKELNNGS